MLCVSMARRHSSESSTDREPKWLTSHYGKKITVITKVHIKTEAIAKVIICTGHGKFYLRIKKMCVDNCSLDVKYVCVVLQRLKRDNHQNM